MTVWTEHDRTLSFGIQKIFATRMDFKNKSSSKKNFC